MCIFVKVRNKLSWKCTVVKVLYGVWTVMKMFIFMRVFQTFSGKLYIFRGGVLHKMLWKWFHERHDIFIRGIIQLSPNSWIYNSFVLCVLNFFRLFRPPITLSPLVLTSYQVSYAIIYLFGSLKVFVPIY